MKVSMNAGKNRGKGKESKERIAIKRGRKEALGDEKRGKHR